MKYETRKELSKYVTVKNNPQSDIIIVIFRRNAYVSRSFFMRPPHKFTLNQRIRAETIKLVKEFMCRKDTNTLPRGTF